MGSNMSISPYGTLEPSPKCINAMEILCQGKSYIKLYEYDDNITMISSHGELIKLIFVEKVSPDMFIIGVQSGSISATHSFIRQDNTANFVHMYPRLIIDKSIDWKLTYQFDVMKDITVPIGYEKYLGQNEFFYKICLYLDRCNNAVSPISPIITTCLDSFINTTG